MVITKKLKMDLTQRHLLPAVDVMQNDSDTRVLELQLYSGNGAWEVPEGVSASVAYRKPDGTVGLYDTLPDGTAAVTAWGNTVTAVVAAQAMTVPGTVELSVIFRDGQDKQLATFCVALMVHEDPGAGVVESDHYINLCAYVPQPAAGAAQGQYLVVDAVNGLGQITGTRAVALPGGGVAMDDSAVGSLAWSGRKIADTLAPAFESSGGTVACNPMEGYPLQVVSAVTAVQSGSGDPSPDNIRPITGWTGAKLTQSNESESREFTLDFGETVYGGTLDWDTGVLTVSKAVLVLDGVNMKLTVDASGEYWNMPFDSVPGIAEGNGLYNSHFPWLYFSANANYAFVYAYAPGRLGALYADADEFNAYCAEQYAAGTPVTILYDLEEARTVQLTPQQILALSGQNTLYTDAGDTQVCGRADPSVVIADIYAKLNALQTAAVSNI